MMQSALRPVLRCALALLACALAPCALAHGTCTGKTMIRSGGLSCADRQAILDGHNRLRQSVALGQVHGQPAAANMKQMVWDENLARTAQYWADQCTVAHDTARVDGRFPVGQNLAATWTTRSSITPEPDFQKQITAWFNEVRSFSFQSTGFSHATGHYSQVVWGDTYMVGCGYSFYYDRSKGYTKLYVCNYGPGGNVIGQKPYQQGSPSCTAYGMNGSNQYHGLCEVAGYSSLGASCSYGGYGGYRAGASPSPSPAPSSSSTYSYYPYPAAHYNTAQYNTGRYYHY